MSCVMSVIKENQFHHQTTTLVQSELLRERCVLSYFIIKPQQSSAPLILSKRCVLSYFIIKPQPFSISF